MHTIRLRGPWEYSVLSRWLARGTEESTEPLPADGKLEMPADWGATLGSDFRGRVRYRRRFGYPTGLQAEDKIDLVFERVNASGRVWLNDVLIGEIPSGGQPAKFSVRQL